MKLRLWALCGLVACSTLPVPALGQGLVRVEPVPGGRGVEAPSGGGPAEKAAFIAQQDDGEVDVFYGGGDTTGTFETAMLFEGIGGPDVTLGSVDVCLQLPAADSMLRYQVVLWAPDGPGGAPGTELAHFAAVATGAGVIFDSTALGYALAVPDVYIGIRYHPVVENGFGFCADRDGATVYPGYIRLNEAGPWNEISTTNDPAYNALMVRALITTPGVFAETLYVPFFLADTTSPVGTNTLFAVRNLTADTVFADVEYLTLAGAVQRTDELTLGPFETATVSVRDVPGLLPSIDGFARGFVRITTAGNPDMTPVLAGDFFQVDVGDDFATGEKLVRQIELCDVASIRFLEFPLPGSGTRLTVWMTNPRGTGGADPPSFTVQVYDEDGHAVGGPIAVKSDRHAREFQATDYTALEYGTLRFDFTNSARGTVYAEASAQGRFSVGVSAQCDELP